MKDDHRSTTYLKVSFGGSMALVVGLQIFTSTAASNWLITPVTIRSPDTAYGPVPAGGAITSSFASTPAGRAFVKLQLFAARLGRSATMVPSATAKSTVLSEPSATSFEPTLPAPMFAEGP